MATLEDQVRSRITELRDGAQWWWDRWRRAQYDQLNWEADLLQRMVDSADDADPGHARVWALVDEWNIAAVAAQKAGRVETRETLTACRAHLAKALGTEPEGAGSE